jgi:prephenate dehydrogenase
LANILKVQNINTLQIEEHDKIVGYVSHLSHIIAVTLMNSFEVSSLSKYAGTSFKEVTRIANINEEIWSELFIGNKKELIPMIENYQKELSKLKEAIKKDNLLEVKEILKESRIKRQEFNKD